MSQSIAVALIGFAGAVVGAAITGFAAIAAAGIRGKERDSISCGVVGLLASLGAAGGLILGAIFGASLIQVQTDSTFLPSRNSPSVTQQPTSFPTPLVVCPSRMETGTGQTVQMQIVVPAGDVLTPRRCLLSPSAK